MKIVTFNLRTGGRRGTNNHWRKILKDLSPDLVLAQETYSPESYFQPEEFSRKAQSAIWTPISKWGSGVLSTRHHMTPIAVPEFEGWVTGARIVEFSLVGGPPTPLSVFSLHTPSPGPYPLRLDRILDRIGDLALDTDLLVGGDFNINTAVRHMSEDIRNYDDNLAIIDRLRREFGLVNAWQAVHPNTNLPQTLRWSGDQSKPYHCDGLFIPVAWLPRLKSCEVLAGDWKDMSDHNPIVASFEEWEVRR